MTKKILFDPEFIVSFDKSITFKSFKDYPDLERIASRWVSKGLENNYLRFNTKLPQNDIIDKLSIILKIPTDKISVEHTPDLKFLHQF